MLSLIISDYSIKKQAFNKNQPKVDDTLIIKIKNCLASRNFIPLPLKNIKNLYKAYIDGKHYRLVVQEIQENSFLLIFFRTKNERYSKNISKHKNDSFNKIMSNYDKVWKDFENKRVKILTFK